jgi:hypothetical protein
VNKENGVHFSGTPQKILFNTYGQQHDSLVLTVKYSQSYLVLYGEVNKIENLLLKFDSFI